jgi:hypothetical protein
MSEFRSKKDGTHYPIGTGSGESQPSIDDAIQKIMGDELKTIGFEGMNLDQAKEFMNNQNSRYLGTAETDGMQFHEWYSDFDGKYTWAVVDGDKILFGGESKSGMMNSNSGTATTEVGSPALPSDNIDAGAPEVEGDNLMEGPDAVAYSRDKSTIQKQNKADDIDAGGTP